MICLLYSLIEVDFNVQNVQVVQPLRSVQTVGTNASAGMC
jgi:hypothetical protein